MSCIRHFYGGSEFKCGLLVVVELASGEVTPPMSDVESVLGKRLIPYINS